jgi:hypothetical protein
MPHQACFLRSRKDPSTPRNDATRYAPLRMTRGITVARHDVLGFPVSFISGAFRWKKHSSRFLPPVC